MLAAIVAALILQTPGGQSPGCVGEETPWLKLDYVQFEEKRNQLPEDSSCLRAQFAVIQHYRDHRHGDMRLLDLYNSAFHQGQLLAMLGSSSEAIPYLLGGVVPGHDPGDFSDYAIGTVASLHHDRESLVAARARLVLRNGEDDLNVATLDGLVTCFNKPYIVAYGDNCRPKRR